MISYKKAISLINKSTITLSSKKILSVNLLIPTTTNTVNIIAAITLFISKPSINLVQPNYDMKCIS